MAERLLDLGAMVEPALGLQGLEVDDELILVDPLRDRSFRLNPTGRWIWMRLQEPCTVKEVAEGLKQTYRLNRQDAEEVAVEYLQRLHQLGVVASQQ